MQRRIRCQNCIHFNEPKECRRYPPVEGVFNQVWEACWCGEYKKRPVKLEPDTRTMELIACYVDVYKEVWKDSPLIEGADAQAAKKLISTYGLEKSKAIVTEFLEEPPNWNRDTMNIKLRDIPRAVDAILARGV